MPTELKPLPHNHEAETALLGGVLLDATACIDEAAALLPMPEAFYSSPHQSIWSTTMRLHGAGTAVDAVTVADAMIEAGTLEAAGGRVYLSDLTMSAVSARNARRYAEIVRDHWLRRRIITTCTEALRAAWDIDEPVQSVLSDTIRRVEALSVDGGAETIRSAKELSVQLVEHLERVIAGNESDADGFRTGFASLDRIIRLRPREMVIIAARPSVGKTALACNLACNLAIAEGVPVGIISLEMDAVRLLARMVSSESGVSEQDLRDAALAVSHYDGLMRAVQMVGGAPIWIDDIADRTVYDVRTVARRMVTRHGVRAIILDYLQYIRSEERGFASRQEAVADISRNLKALAKQLGIPVVVLAQLNRDAEGAPRISHLRESGAIEQDADIIALLHDKSTDQDTATCPVDVIVAKHRNGATGTAHLQFRPSIVRFEEPSRARDETEEDKKW